MGSHVRTCPFEVSEEAYVNAMTPLIRRRFLPLNIAAGIGLAALAFFVIKLPWWGSLALMPALIAVAHFRTPHRIRRNLRSLQSARLEGSIVLHVDEDALLHAPSAGEVSIVKWPEFRRAYLLGGSYVLDAGFDDFIITSGAFETATDELNFQAILRERIRRIHGF